MGNIMYDVTAIGELLIDFAALSSDSAGYPTMKANPAAGAGEFLAALNAYGARTAFWEKLAAMHSERFLYGLLPMRELRQRGS